MLLEVSLHALRLKNVAGAFKGTSDPFAVVTKIGSEAKPVVLGKTEVIKNDLSPNWVKVFKLEYELGDATKLAVSLFDKKTKSDNLPMGSAVFDVAEVLGARGNTKGKRVNGGGT
jgi:Ca2+-dependent lipid-binding protein